jgi:hypothetical protein
MMVLLIFAAPGQSMFARLEIEAPGWREIIKWLTMRCYSSRTAPLVRQSLSYMPAYRSVCENCADPKIRRLVAIARGLVPRGPRPDLAHTTARSQTIDAGRPVDMCPGWRLCPRAVGFLLLLCFRLGQPTPAECLEYGARRTGASAQFTVPDRVSPTMRQSRLAREGPAGHRPISSLCISYEVQNPAGEQQRGLQCHDAITPPL